MERGTGFCLVLLFVGVCFVWLVWFFKFYPDTSGFSCCLSHSASCLTHPVLQTTAWLCCLNNTQVTFAKHAASNAFTNVDLTIPATTLGCFLSFHVPGHRELQPWEVSPKFLLEPVPFTWLPDVATSELNLFPRRDEAEPGEKSCDGL